MRRLVLIIKIFSFLFLTSCASITETSVDTKTFKIRKRINLHKQQDSKRLDLLNSCTRTWHFQQLDSSISIKIIQYHKTFRFDLTRKPALIIGIVNQDTIRVLINDLSKDFVNGQIIKIYPDSSIDINNNISMVLINRDLPVFLSDKKTEDRFFCDIKKTYFGKINK
jgi:hypothetical protein